MFAVTGGGGFGAAQFGWDLSQARYDGVSFGSSAEEIQTRGLFFKPDGTKLYTIGIANDLGHQYSLSTPWDISTATYDNQTFFSSSLDTGPQGLFFKPEGDKLYVVGIGNDAVYQFTLSSAWASSTATYDNISFSSTLTEPTDVAFNYNGTKMYILGNGVGVLQYSLSVAWASSTATYDNVSYSTTSDTGFFFKPDGTKMYTVGSADSRVYQHSLSVAWATSTLSYDNISFGSSTEENLPTGLFFKNDGTKMYIIGDTNDMAYQYSL